MCSEKRSIKTPLFQKLTILMGLLIALNGISCNCRNPRIPRKTNQAKNETTDHTQENSDQGRVPQDDDSEAFKKCQQAAEQGTLSVGQYNVSSLRP